MSDQGPQPSPPQHPPPGQWSAGYAPPPPATPQSVNGFAVAALILGIIGVFVLGLVFGFVALRQIKRTGQAGRGQAIAGIVLSIVWMVVITVVVVLVVMTGATRGEGGEISSGGSIGVEMLSLGDCLNNLEEGTQLSVEAVPCAEPHQAQVYAVSTFEGGPYPGDDSLGKDTEQRCVDLMRTDFPEAFADDTVQVFFFHPTSDSWARGDHEMVCVALYTDGPRRGSLLD